MAWTAAVMTVTKNMEQRQIVVVITVSGGAEPYPLALYYPFDDVRFGMKEIKSRVREFVAQMKEVEANYDSLKALEGTNLPLSV